MCCYHLASQIICDDLIWKLLSELSGSSTSWTLQFVQHPVTGKFILVYRINKLLRLST